MACATAGRKTPEGILETFARGSPGDGAYDILSKLSASSLHQIRHIRDCALMV
jgi:hypothetical protein